MFINVYGYLHIPSIFTINVSILFIVGIWQEYKFLKLTQILVVVRYAKIMGKFVALKGVLLLLL